MRIACVHIPQFALQCATRVDPSLRRAHDGVGAGTGAAGSHEGASGAPVIVVGPASVAGVTVTTADARTLHAPIVLACSRAAWALGARVGMTATAARGLSPLIEVVTSDVQRERDTMRAIADVLLGISPVVDLGGRVGRGGAHLAIYCEVPAKTRGTTYGERLLECLESLGLTARIGIADDRFTAWVAASSHTPAIGGVRDPHDRLAPSTTRTRHDDVGVVSVPRGGSAAFLAPHPLSLLAITPEVQHMLEALGVRTLGEFAALPAPTVSPRGARFEADYQALARGESGNVLRPYAPDAPIREDVVIRSLVHASASLATVTTAVTAAASAAGGAASAGASAAERDAAA
ncbi:MAG TPA: hypothetical protein VK427_07865, partial [Kofleriaceae bacterium]|nr:hypothetical protein [Kofleriaceae bacterium]